MRAIIWIVLLFTVCTACTETGAIPEAKTIAQKKFGDLIREPVHQVNDPLFSKYFPGEQLYFFSVYNERSMLAGREEYPYTLIIEGKQQSFITGKEGILPLLKKHMHTKTAKEAEDALRLYTLLRRVSIVNQSYVTERFRQQAPVIHDLKIEHTNGTYHVTAYADADPAITAIIKITGTFSRTEFNISEEFIASAGGYD